MRTVQMTLDDDLVDAVDVIVKEMKTTRWHSQGLHCGKPLRI
jgi:hypothetical protein